MRKTIAQLEQQIKILEARIALIQADCDHRIAAANSRRDPLMEQRMQLASQLGQMIEATSKAIMFIIGKEAL